MSTPLLHPAKILRRQPGQRRRGATFLLFTLVAFPLLMLAGMLSVDVSTVYLARRQVRVAADAAALAGADTIKANTTQLCATATETGCTESAAQWALDAFKKNVAANVTDQVNIAAGYPKVTLIQEQPGKPTVVQVTVHYTVKSTLFLQYFQLQGNITGTDTEYAAICNGAAAPISHPIVVTKGKVTTAVVGDCPRPRG